MPGRVLLVSINACEDPYAVFPLGLACLDAALSKAGYQTQWLDCRLAPDGIEECLATFQPDFVGLSLRNIDDVLIKRRETFFGALEVLTNRIRLVSKAVVVLGGSGFSIFPEELLRLSGADYGIRGEGEVSLVALLAALERGEDPCAIPGLVFRCDGKVIVNRPRGVPLTTLERPRRPGDLVARYLSETGMLNLQTQRGCSCLCSYCTYPILEGRYFRGRGAEEVAEEMLELQRLGARYVVVVDSVFNSSPEHVARMCEAMIKREVKLRWCCFLRPAGLTAELARLMARAGLAHVEFGSDSLCDDVLAAYRKSFGFDDIRRSHELVRHEEIDCCHFLICGGPGETRETLQTTLNNSQRLKGGAILPMVGMRVYPGTELHARALREGSSWTAADLLQPRYYIAQGLTEEMLLAQMRKSAEVNPDWIVGEPPARYLVLIERLRQRGVIGPLWSYWCMMQRLTPSATFAGAAM